MKTSLAILLSAVLLGGCVYGKDEARAPERPPGAPPAQAASPQPDRVTAEDLGRLNPGTGVPGPGDGRIGTDRVGDDRGGRDRIGSHDPRGNQRIFVQAASFVTREQAERARRGVAGLGPSGIYTAYVDDQLRYRVRIGPMRTPEGSERVRAALVRRGFADAIIVRD